jgi:hypothetical protein
MKSLGPTPTIMFECHSGGACHGDFQDASYQAILGRPDLAARLAKSHPQRGALLADRKEDAMELDSSNSSDALLLTCFCHPGAAAGIFGALLPELPTGDPEFGVPGCVSLKNGKRDQTEIDMWAGKVIFEGKLTEADFTQRPKPHVERYESFSRVFDTRLLPQTTEAYIAYQLIRNVLAAAEHGYHFMLICDARRPDQLREWWRVHGAILDADVRASCGFLLWQEIAIVCPPPLRQFLKEKYGL